MQLLVGVWLVVHTPPASAGAARHWRLATSHGPVHVWTPAGYDAASAGIVLYVHGYFTDVDQAWKFHRLSRQFAESGLNAMFIACEAPSAPGDEISWASAGQLLEAVGNRLDQALPEGLVVALGHSAAHRTFAEWVEHQDELDSIAMLDAMYGEQPEIRTWIEGSDERRLIDVGDVTRPWTDQLHAELPETKVYEQFPPASLGHLSGARSARIVYVRTRLGHMSLATGGVAIPMVLRASRIRSLPSSSRQTPIHAL